MFELMKMNYQKNFILRPRLNYTFFNPLNVLALLIIFMAVTFPLMALAQTITASASQVSDYTVLLAAIDFFKNIKGKGTLLIIAGVIQVLALFLKAPLGKMLSGKLSGKWQLIIITTLNFLGTLLAAYIGGDQINVATDFPAVTALQIGTHQYLKKFGITKVIDKVSTKVVDKISKVVGKIFKWG